MNGIATEFEEKSCMGDIPPEFEGFRANGSC
jgi:hypothetical protein